MGFGVDEIGGTESATVFQAISTTTLLEPVSPSAHQRSCAIGESATGTFPFTGNAGNTLSAGCPLILGGVLNLREKLGDRFVLRIRQSHPDYSHSFQAPQIAAPDSGSPVDRRPSSPRLGSEGTTSPTANEGLVLRKISPPIKSSNPHFSRWIRDSNFRKISEDERFNPPAFSSVLGMANRQRLRRPLIIPYQQRRRLRGLPPAGHACHPF